MPGPSNLYGVANSPAIYSFAGIGGPVNCPQGVETNVLDSGLMVAPSQGWFYPVIFSSVAFQYGATNPNPLIMAARIGAGADFASYGVNAAAIVVNTTQMEWLTLLGPASQAPWVSPGSHIYLTVNPGAAAVTVSNYATQAYFMLLRAPDQ